MARINRGGILPAVDPFLNCHETPQHRKLLETGIYPYFRAISSSCAAPEVLIEGRRVLMFGSNNYLGLTEHPRVREAARDAISRYGTSCTGSRFMNGTLALHEELEERLAKFMRRGAALVFSTGFQVNLGVIPTLVGKTDVVISDRRNHASLVDGCRLSLASCLKYQHSDTDQLHRLCAAVQDNCEGALVVTDGVFSMEGDLAELSEIVRLRKEYGFRIYLDDAHGIGVLGEHGRGTAEHFGVEEDVDLIAGTFSKSLASLGGFIAGDARVIKHIKHHARPFIFSAAPSPANAAAALAALDVLETEPEHLQRLRDNARELRHALWLAGINTGAGCTPILSVLIGDDEEAFRVWARLFEAGVYVNCVVAPATEPGRAALRLSVSAAHTPQHLQEICERLSKALAKP